MKAMDMSRLSFGRASELLSYDKVSGELRWKVGRGGGAKQGSRAGSATKGGYRTIGIDGVRFVEHRVAWLLAHGSPPTGELDHINGRKDDNRLCNLRDVGRAENNQNQIRPRSDNTSGFLGVSAGRPGRWNARLRVSGRNIHLGSFSSPEEAHAAYVAAKREMHPGCTI